MTTHSTSCSICLDDILTQEEYVLKCNHNYHKKCITEWLIVNTTCPLCRTTIEPEECYLIDNIITQRKLNEIKLIKNSFVKAVELIEDKTLYPFLARGKYLSRFAGYILDTYGKEFLEEASKDEYLKELCKEFIE